MRDRSLVSGVAVTFISFLLVLVLLLVGLSVLRTRNTAELSASLKASVLRTLLTCYAVEGRYPSDVAYLEDNYGLAYDSKRFFVSLNAFADNILPDISVLQIREGSQK